MSGVRRERVLAALCESLCSTLRDPTDPRLAPPYDDVAAVVRQQQERLALHFALPLRTVLILFDLFAAFWLGGVFHRQPLAVRTGYLAAWRSTAFRPARDFVRFYESLCAMALFHRLEEKRAPNT
jgi:hypothetical protein